ncbi:amidase family protein [Natranaerobius thermophilus]|uniref:Amidase n=1 Tax=Natranaerobius thermophilus (strain ATCC BAA-1301 / DSM 18059 / JW/NM-WN-LF) TaxID=457570 RepID=B2A6I4_NATTJ|nr:amidase family protein [Natranaerobius thermophilus]ACB85517.1 Amidase [Natranaerobius thermophilus JW/NM-WN-LF]
MYSHFLNKWQQDYLLETTVDELQDYMEKGEITSRDLVLMYQNRIACLDQDGPKINSIIEMNPEALQIAQALDRERKYKGPRSKLHGIPVLLKDNIDTEDKMRTSAGSIALEEHVAREDAFIVKKLRQAGAVILGKANLTEWANFMADNMPNGYSSRGGQVLNPYGPGELDCGGSSSGSAAALAANFTVLAIGTETSGSILSPASDNSVVGIKPTVGLWSRSGIIPISHSQDTAGPMARTVEDAAILLEILSGPDAKDPVTLTKKDDIDGRYTNYLNAHGLKGTRLGVSQEFLNLLEDSELDVIEKAIKNLENLGAHIVSGITYPPKIDWDLNVLLHEFKVGINTYLRNTGDRVPVKSLTELINFNYRNKEIALKYGQERLLKSNKTKGTLTEPEYLKSREHDLFYSKDKGIDAVMEEYNLDALIFPANLGANIPARAGYPSITVPAGYNSTGKPIGLTFTAKAYEEGKLIKIAYSYEQAVSNRVPPQK